MNFEIEKILLSILIGGLIGMEREFRDKAAGFRTMIFISLGTTLFTLLSMQYQGGDPSRVAAGLVTGIGFIGTGVILHTRGQILGLTTAAIIWITAAIGMCIGLGLYKLAFVAACAALAILWMFPFLEKYIQLRRESMLFSVTYENKEEILNEIFEKVKENRLHVLTETYEKEDKFCTLNIKLVGSKERLHQINKYFINSEKILNCKL